MCGRFMIARKYHRFEQLQLSMFPDFETKAEGEICPSNIIPVIILEDDREDTRCMQWGFPGWQGKPLIINARAETCASKKMFAESLQQRRAAIPATGFYEWKALVNYKKRQKFIFNLPDEEFLFLAGIWNRFAVPKDGPIPEHFTILTTEANPDVRGYHDRMPVLLAEHEVSAWLRGEDLDYFLTREQFSLNVTDAGIPCRNNQPSLFGD